MNIRSITQMLLLAFVAVGLGFAIASVAGWTSASATNDSAATMTDVATVKKEGPWVAYFFHVKHRCPTCQSIEAYAHKALMPEIERGELIWRVADYTAPKTAPWLISSR